MLTPQRGVKALCYQAAVLAARGVHYSTQHHLGHRPLLEVCLGIRHGPCPHGKETDKQEISKEVGLASSFHSVADVKSLGIQT